MSRWATLGLLIGLGACRSGQTENQLLRLHLAADELAQINDKVGQANNGTVAALETTVAKNHNQRQEIAVLKASRSVRAETQQLVHYLRGLRQQLSPAGKAPMLPQLADRQAVDEVLLRGGQADTLQRRLSRYAAAMRQYVAYGTVPPLAAAGADPRVQAVTGEKPAEQSFRELYFQDASVATARAVLVRQEAAVLRLESDALSELSKRVGYGDYFDKIGAFASAESNTVAEGETYRAELFLTASASGHRPRMTLNGRPLTVGPDGKGRVTLTAPRLAPGQSRQTVTWEGAITLPNHGRDTTFRIRVPYTIVPRR